VDSRRVGVYAQDEWQFARDWILNAGVRYDDPSNADADWNYRLGPVGRPRKETALKMLYGTAARAPNVHELFYTVPGATPFEPNPLLSLEHIQTAEIVREQVVADHLKFTASAYRCEMKGLINQEIVNGALMSINIPPSRLMAWNSKRRRVSGTASPCGKALRCRRPIPPGPARTSPTPLAGLPP
jgi:outer membrane cobalamin receptor